VVDFVRAQTLTVDWILETHAHADHLSAAPFLKRELGGRIAIGAGIAAVQGVFKGIFNLEPEFRTDGSQFDTLLRDGEVLSIGRLQLRAMSVPGHTPACMAFQVGGLDGDANGEPALVFVGDTLFMPDVGTARCDFPGGDAQVLYRSVRKLLSLPPATRLLMCHDYPPTTPEGTRGPQWDTTVEAQRAHNVHIRDGISEAEFVAMRHARDATLAMPVLMLPSVQVNIRAGSMPPPETNGISYLKIPVNAL
jgi:glyoxylase-like metal-dependent hydrolase (beta-lactamase superfamily II)